MMSDQVAVAVLTWGPFAGLLYLVYRTRRWWRPARRRRPAGREPVTLGGGHVALALRARTIADYRVRRRTQRGMARLWATRVEPDPVPRERLL